MTPEVTAADRARAEALLERLYCHSHVEAAVILAATLATVRADGRAAWVELEDCRSYVAEIAQGVSHYPHDDGEPCVRCERDTLQARVAALEAALREIAALPADTTWPEIERICREAHAPDALS